MHSDPRIYYDPKTKKIVRTEPPGLMELIQPVEGTNLVSIPERLFDLDTFRIVPIQASIIRQKPG